MLPDPLHPAVVHFPIVLMLAFPVVVWVAFRVLGRGAEVRPVWMRVVTVAFALTAVSWFALETGASDEEAVAAVVAEALLDAHSNAAALFMALSGVVALLSLAGLMKERAGTAARYATAVGAVLLVVAGVRVGHTGGKLVYDYGAASAYVVSGETTPAQAGAASISDRDDEEQEADDDDDDDRGGR